MALSDDYEGRAFTLTYAPSGENHVGNQIVGTVSNVSFSPEELHSVHDFLNTNDIGSEVHILNEYLPEGYFAPDAALLIIPDGVKKVFDVNERDLFDECESLSYDNHYLDTRFGGAKQKHARWNTIFADFTQDANYEEGKGSVYNFNSLPLASTIRTGIPYLFGDKAANLIAEVNYYRNVYPNQPKKHQTGIGFHTDKERNMVIGVRIGASFPLSFAWYEGATSITEAITFELDAGTVYVMSAEAVRPTKSKDKSLRSSTRLQLKHAAGGEKYLELKK